ncbi:uridine kinase family protein [Demequina globuliformis]|uniref:uridine kinase family protein n=1 Tax=Demequina globuliformis TaxID=676202 RepID=UPI000781DB52|nr:hypothetical protein [Demequina globuliformis]
MPQATLTELVALIRSAPPSPGGTSIVLIDGPAGSGKTTLASRLAVALGGAEAPGPGTFDPAAPTAADSPVQIIHADDMYEGWTGMSSLDTVLVEQVLMPVSAGETGGFEMWDWHRHERTHHIAVPPGPVLIAEGVGVGRRAAREVASLLLWIEAPDDLRLQRGLARDGAHVRHEWMAWMRDEATHFAAHSTRDHAHVILDGTAPIPD